MKVDAIQVKVTCANCGFIGYLDMPYWYTGEEEQHTSYCIHCFTDFMDAMEPEEDIGTDTE